ncbi:MAG: hypothetical protein ACRC1K_04330, partial [Planctomycetia bacterium]
GGRDGSVVAVTDAGRKIYIDVGLKQGVRAALMFGVYGLDVGGNPLQYPKAAIEVSEVLDQNSSVARLIFASVSDPILPGDLLFNPIWSIGDNETIAVAGVIDLTGDGRPDNAEFKRVVEENGGRVESEIEIDTGKLRGQINVRTGWLVIGEPLKAPADAKPEDEARVKTYNDSMQSMRVNAGDAGVRVINARNFLSYLSYNLPTRQGSAAAEHLAAYVQPRRQAKAMPAAPGAAAPADVAPPVNSEENMAPAPKATKKKPVFDDEPEDAPAPKAAKKKPVFDDEPDDAPAPKAAKKKPVFDDEPADDAPKAAPKPDDEAPPPKPAKKKSSFFDE